MLEALDSGYDDATNGFVFQGIEPGRELW